MVRWWVLVRSGPLDGLPIFRSENTETLNSTFKYTRKTLQVLKNLQKISYCIVHGVTLLDKGNTLHFTHRIRHPMHPSDGLHQFEHLP